MCSPHAYAKLLSSARLHRQEPGFSIPHSASESRPESSHSQSDAEASGWADAQEPGSHSHQPSMQQDHVRRWGAYTGIDLAARREAEGEDDFAGGQPENEAEFQEVANRIGTDLDRQLMGGTLSSMTLLICGFTVDWKPNSTCQM